MRTLTIAEVHHQVPTETECHARVANGSVHALAQSLRQMRWENLALRMVAAKA